MVVTTSMTQIVPALKRQGSRIGGGGDDDIIRACRGLAILTKEVKR
jgi:hypothetical protein